MSLVATLSLADKIKLNLELASSLVEKDKKTKKPRKTSTGNRAWTAFVAHVQKTMPEKFAPPALPKDRLQIAGEIRLSDPAAYEQFCAQFKADNPEPESAEESTESQGESQAEPEAKPEKPKRVISEEQKAKMKAGREKKAAEKKAAAAAAASP